MNTNKLELKKHSAIIQMSNKVTLQQRKVFNVLLYLARTILKDNKPDCIFKSNLENIKRLAGINSTNNTQLKDALNRLTEIKIEYNIFNKDKKKVWGKFVLLAGAEISDGIVKFGFAPQIYETILRPELYAILDLNIIKGLESKHAIALYELARDYIKAEIPTISIENLKNFFGINNNQYKNCAHLKEKIVDIAINEINSKTDINIRYETISQGRKIIAFKFYTNKKQESIEQLLLTAPIEKKQPSIPVPAEAENAYNRLIAIHMTKKVAQELIKKHPLEKIEQQLDWLIYHKPDNPPAMLKTAIEQDWAMPTEFQAEQKLKEQKEKLEDLIQKAKTATYVIFSNGKKCKIHQRHGNPNDFIEVEGEDKRSVMVRLNPEEKYSFIS